MRNLLLGLVLLTSFSQSILAASNDVCYDLWHQRNLIFAQKGYCFDSNLGKQVFSNFECLTRSPVFSPNEKETINQIKARESQLHCNINTALTREFNSNLPSTSSEMGIKCSDIEYGTDSYFDKMEELSKKAKLPDSYFNKYHEDVVSSLCSDNTESVDNLIDYGYVDAIEVEAISKILSKPYKIKARSEIGKSFGYSREKFIEMGLCSACADNVSQYYTEKPSSPCGVLAKQALEGNLEAVNKLNESPDYCTWQYEEVLPAVQQTIQSPQPEVQSVTPAIPQNIVTEETAFARELELPKTNEKKNELFEIASVQRYVIGERWIVIFASVVVFFIALVSIVLYFKKSPSLPSINNQVKTEQLMSETKVNTLKDKISTKTWHLLLLASVTAGIYPILWLYRNYKAIDEVTNSKTASDSFIIWIAVCVGLGSLVPRDQAPLHLIIILLLGISVWVLYAIWAFRARKALQEYCLTVHKIDLRMNAFYTLFFHIYYINYCINDLEEVARKHKILYQS